MNTENCSNWNDSKNYGELILKQSPFGWEYTEQSIAGLDHFKFEEIDPFYWQSLLESNPQWAFYAGAVYILTIFSLEKWMRNKPAYKLEGPLFIWNALIGTFSIVGFLRTAPGFFWVVAQPGGFYDSICTKKNANAQLGFWALAFVLSKFLELGDTVFIVLRKRKLVFLQWWHHMATMLVCWIIGPLMEPVTRWTMVLNYGVHALMYPYFALRAIGIKFPTFVPNYITTMQFSQFIIGTGAFIWSMYYYQAGYDCTRYPLSINVSLFTYAAFLVLFGRLFYDSVINKGREKKELEKCKVKDS